MTPAEQLVRRRIAEEGPQPFGVVVEIALYDPEAGFFATVGRAGRRSGHFVTSPETGPLFGVLVGRYLDRIWDGLGRPDHFTFVDAGAGPGTLARTVRAAGPACLDALEVVLVERSAAQRALHPGGCTSRPTMPSEPVAGVILANELLDNVPFRIAESTDGGWAEVLVDVVDGGLGWVLGDVVPAWDELPEGPTGVRVPVAEGACQWVEEALAGLARGALVALDYGATTAELAARDGGWLRTYAGHERGLDPFAGLGSRDVTIDVPLDQLPAPDRLVLQGAWLEELGIDELVDEGRRTWNEKAATADLAALAARSRINEAAALTDPNGLGGFSVLEWRR